MQIHNILMIIFAIFFLAYDYDDAQYAIDFLTMKKKLNDDDEIIEEDFDEEKVTEFFVRYPLTNTTELSNAEEQILQK